MCCIPTETPFKSGPILGGSTGLFLVITSSWLFWWWEVAAESVEHAFFLKHSTLQAPWTFLVFSSPTHPLPLEFLFFLFVLSKHGSWAALMVCFILVLSEDIYILTFLPWLFACIQYIKQFCKYLLYTYLVIYSLVYGFLLCARQCPHTGNSKKKVSTHPKTHYWSRGRNGECHERYPGAIRTEGGSDPAWRLEKVSQRGWHLMWTLKRE